MAIQARVYQTEWMESIMNDKLLSTAVILTDSCDS